jgi:hypothetical protein
LATAFGLLGLPLMHALTFVLQSAALTCAAEPPMTAKASRVRTITLFMYLSQDRQALEDGGVTLFMRGWRDDGYVAFPASGRSNMLGKSN